MTSAPPADTTPPALSTVTPIPSPSADSTPNFTFSSDEAGTLSMGGACGTSSSTAVSAGNTTITLTQTDNSTPLADGSYSTCTVTMTDAASNASTPLAINTFTVDATGPQVSSVGVPANATYTAGQDLDFTVNFDEAVTVNTGSGTPSIELTIGSATRQTAYVSGSPGSALTFRYTVQAGENDSDGIAVSALSANGGTLRDGADNDANLTLKSIGSTSGVLVDTTPPAQPPAPDLAAASDSGASSTDDITNVPAATFTGTAETGASVELFADANNNGAVDGGESLGTGAAAGGSWSIAASSLSEGVNAVRVTATDAAGNASSASPVLSMTLDITDPTVAFSAAAGPFTGPFDVDATVSADAASSFVEGDVSITGGSITPASFTDNGGGSFTFEVTPSTAGTVTIETAAGAVEDAAGNQSAAASISRTVNAPTVTLSVSDASPGEADGSVTLTATLSSAFSASTTVNLSYSGTASGGGTDYDEVIPITIAANALTGTATLNLTNDALDEAGETIIVDIDSVSGGAVEDGTQQVTVTITDDDAAPAISIADFADNENAGAASFDVTLDGPSGQTVQVSYATSAGTATAGTDYTTTAGTLTFNPGDTVETITVPVSGDAIVELDETFTVLLSSTSNATLSDSEATGAITNDDAATLSIADVTQAEGDSGTSTFDFTVTLSAESDAAVDFTASTADGTGEAGTDYVALSATPFTIAAGDTTATVQVTVAGDAGFEPGETFTVTLAGLTASGRAVSFADDEATGTIGNDDGAPTLSLSSPTVSEDAGTAVVTATLDAPAGAPVTFTWSTQDGSAAAPEDFTAVAGAPATIAPGATSVDLPVTLIDDAAEELAETFQVAITGLSNAIASGTDTPVTIELSDIAAPEPTLSAAEGPVAGAFTVSVAFTEAVTGLALSDFDATNAALSDLTGSGDAYTLTVTPSVDGAVTLALPAGAAEDGVGTPSNAAEPLSLTADLTAPGVVLSTEASGVISGPFQITITFTEAVSGFELADLAVENGEAFDLATDDDTVFTATITPDADGTATVSLAAAAASDAAGNASTEAEPLSVETDATPPGLEIALPGEETTGVFTATFTFTQPVEGFELADITVENGVATALVSSNDTVFTAEITPQAPGTVTVSVGAGAAADAAGNASLEASAAIAAVSQAEAVVLILDATVGEPGDVSERTNVTNPGSDPLSFTAAADVPWIDVDPTSGTIPALGSLEFEITLTDAVEALSPGDYTGTVTVSAGGASAPAGAMTTASSAGTVLVEIPISLEVQARFGSVTLVATPPSGASGEASFTYASDIDAFDALTLTTSAGRASASVAELLQGAYQITQALPAGWRLESVSCAGDIDGGSSFDVKAGGIMVDLDANEALVCTFENVRDEDAVRLATQRAIRGFIARRADRIVEAAPDLSRRFDERATTRRGSMGADVDGSGRYQMDFTASLSGARNAAAEQDGAARFASPERPFLDGWDAWLAAEVSGVSDNRAGEDAESDFGVAQLGVDYQLGPDLIVGALAQYDWMSETAQEIFEEVGAIRGARVEGEGWMAGPYAVWRIRDSLILDGLAMYGRSDNQVDPLGLYEDDFETDRFMVRANLTGQFVSGAWRLRPQAGLTHFEETQAAYTDSLAILIPEQTVSLGRLRVGPEVAWRHEHARGGWLELMTAVNAVWDYQTAELFNEAGLLVGGDDDLRADARFAISALTRWGAIIRVETGFDGMGIGDFEARTGRFEIRIPFGASGAGGAGASYGSALLGSRACGGLANDGFALAAGVAQDCAQNTYGPAAGPTR